MSDAAETDAVITNSLFLGFGTEKFPLSFKQAASFLQCSLQIWFLATCHAKPKIHRKKCVLELRIGVEITAHLPGSFMRRHAVRTPFSTAVLKITVASHPAEFVQNSSLAQQQSPPADVGLLHQTLDKIRLYSWHKLASSEP